jgi:probable F420-dependent oxidoreductase
MKIGILTIGMGNAAWPAAIGEVARHAERLGIATLWAPEHVVLFNSHESKYPYAASGRFPLGADADWLDPLLSLTFAAAATSKVRLATGICLVPEHNPLVLAKQVATLDRLSGGRFALGVGIGWLEEEFRALGIPWERRADRTREYIAAMRNLWSEPFSSFKGDFLNFANVGAYPKPAAGARLPIIFGGESTPALRRTAEYGDGWFGFNLTPAEAAGKIAKLRGLVGNAHRDFSEIEVIVSPYLKPIVSTDLRKYSEAGVHEVVMVFNPPPSEKDTAAKLERFARDFVEPAAALS